ncbi:MAG: hypothetical protein ACI8WW_002322, partial [Oceanospirillaceae bacterium]
EQGIFLSKAMVFLTEGFRGGEFLRFSTLILLQIRS